RVRQPTSGFRTTRAADHGTLSHVHDVLRTPGSVKLRTGGYSPRPVRCQRPVDQVKFLDRRLKSGWEAVRGGRRAYVARSACRPLPEAAPQLTRPRPGTSASLPAAPEPAPVARGGSGGAAPHPVERRPAVR